VKSGVHSVVVGKPDSRNPLGRPRRIWVYNISMDLWGEGGLKLLVVETWWKETTGGTRRRWVDSIRKDRFGEVVYSVLVGKPD
jgi:hypothetical protein